MQIKTIIKAHFIIKVSKILKNYIILMRLRRSKYLLLAAV